MPIRRSHIALLLTAVICLNTLAVPISYLNFRVNQDYYASVLCENPEKPITVCGGVCYLKKQLPQPESSEPARFVSKIDISIYYEEITQISFDQSRETPPYGSATEAGQPSSCLASPFHPPRS